MHWLLPHTRPPAPTQELDAAIEAQAMTQIRAAEISEALDDTKANIEDATARSTERINNRKPHDARIRAARDALKILEHP